MKATKLPVPAGMTREMQGDRLVMRWFWRDARNIFALVAFAIVWNAAMLVWFFHADLQWHALTVEKCFALMFMGAGVFFAYSCLAAFLNITTVEVTPQAIRVTTGPVPWHRERQVGVTEIVDVIYREKAQKGYDTIYRVLAVLADGRERKLVTGLTDYEVTVFYVREIRAALNLPDVTLSPDA